MRCNVVGFVVSLSVTLALVAPAAGVAQQDVFALDGLIVTASPAPRSAESVASHVTILSGDELRAQGIRLVADALRGEASIDVVRNGSFGGITSLFVRGGESDHTLVLVDGVQVNQAGGAFDFASLTTDNVERIEIARGPASALYGSDAMAGVIHVVTRTGRGAPKATARFETSFYDEPRDEAVDGLRWVVDLTGGSDRFGYSAAISHEKQEGIMAFNNRFLNTVGTGTARFAPDDRTRLGLTLQATDREFHTPTDGSGNAVDQNQFHFGDEILGRLSAARRLTDVIELEGAVSLNETDGGTDDRPDDLSDTDGYQSLDHFRRAAAEVRASATVEGVVATVGGELEQERQRSFSEAQSSFGPFYGRSESERENWAGFAHLAGDQGAFAYNVGGRLEDNERYGSIVTWQMGFTAHLPERISTRLRASVGTGIKEPTFYENFANDGFSVGNPDLDPERSLSWEVGLEHEIVEGLALQATYFDQRFEDLIQYVGVAPSPGEPNFYNVAEAGARGLEIGADVRFRGLDGGAAYTWLDTDVTDAGFDSGSGAYFVEGETLLRRPTHAFAARAAGAVAERGRLHTRISYVGERADRSFDPVTFAPARVDLPSYLLWTLGADWRVLEAAPRRPSLTISVRAENLLDEEYQEAYGYDAPGRQIYVGLSMGVGS